LIWELYKQLAGLHSTVWLQGTGAESRDYLDIDDVWAALFQLINHRLRIRMTGQYLVVNIASGEETRVLELAEQLRDLVAPEKAIRCRGVERPGDPRRWCADVSLLASLVPGWQPKPFSLALSQCVAVWQKEREISSDEA
jgi:nucleoside-diphosphate-sugar epimerase